MPVKPDSSSRLLAACALALSALAACAPEQVDMNVHDIFTGDAARYALQTQMSPSLLASVGGFLPASTWPSSAAPLLVDVSVVAENQIDLAGSNIDVSKYSGVRLHWTTLAATAISSGPLLPTPTQVELYVGPAASMAITDQGVHPLASGAFPATLPAGSADADAGLGGDDAGTDDSDAGAEDAGASDAGSADAGPSEQTLVFASDAQETLQDLVLAGQPFALFVVLHVPIDSASNPALPTGGADLSFDVQFELAR